MLNYQVEIQERKTKHDKKTFHVNFENFEKTFHLMSVADAQIPGSPSFAARKLARRDIDTSNQITAAQRNNFDMKFYFCYAESTRRTER